MREIKSVCVYCGANTGNNSKYIEVARHVGEVIGNQKLRLVYGGGNVGLMGVMATAAKIGGAEIIGVIPQSLIDMEIAMLDVHELIVVNTMHERKATMETRSDAFIAMPGGFGTLDEFFEIVTWAQLGFHAKPVGLLNVGGYFDHLIKFMDQAVSEGFVKPSHRNMIHIDSDFENLLKKLKQ